MQTTFSRLSPNKISIAKAAHLSLPSYNENVFPSLPNHISWEEEGRHVRLKQGSHLYKGLDQAVRTRRRKKIFEPWEGDRSKSKTKVLRVDVSQVKCSQTLQSHLLRKVKSSTKILQKNPRPQSEVDNRLRQINRQLDQHRNSRDTLATSQRKRSDPQQTWSTLQQKLTESTAQMRRQQQLLTQQMPRFQQKIDKNNSALFQMSSLLQSKLYQNNLNVSRMIQKVNQNQSRLKIKEEQFYKINSSLLHKQMELMRNKEENRRNQLELMRVKRIEDLQMRNLELYKAIEQQEMKQFQSLRLEEIDDVIEGDVWDEDSLQPSKFSHYQESTIKHAAHNTSSSYRSVNNTIGDILSPLAFNEQQYCV